MRKAIFAGSFDPIHEGHVSIYKKSSKLFDEVILYVTVNPEKENMDTIKERAQKVKQTLPNAQVLSGTDLTINIAKDNKCEYLVRGIRNNSDINFEIELASGNKSLDGNIETVLILPDVELKNLSSSTIKMMEQSKKNAKAK